MDDNSRNFIGEVLSEAPLAIATLSSLIVKGNQAFDTNIDHNVPEGGFKFIKWPKSFVSSLAQVGHEGSLAFLKAHTNMNKIRLNSRNIPKLMKQITNIYESGQPSIIKLFINRPLITIRNSSIDNMRLAKEILDLFEKVINLIMEVIQATTNSNTIKKK